MIDQIKEKSFLGNLTHINRFAGHMLIKDESVADHIIHMNYLAIAIVPEINKRIIEYNKENNNSIIKLLNLENIIYRIAVHDLDESITFDFPRPIKYHNTEITKAIYNTTQLILKDHLDSELINDINSAKDLEFREGYLVALYDTLQAGLKMQLEIELGNKRFKNELKNVIEILNEKLSEIDKLPYDGIFIKSVKEIINDYIIEFKEYV